MANLTAPEKREYGVNCDPMLNNLPASAEVIYEGAALSVDVTDGGVHNLAIADANFAGFAQRTVDNSAGSVGDEEVRTQERGTVILAVDGVNSIFDYGKAVYATDGNSFGVADGGGTNTFIGRVRRFIDVGVAVVYFEASGVRGRV